MNTDSIKSLYDYISDRVKDPFLGMYSFFVIIFNWKIWLVTFSSETFYYKMFVVENLIKNDRYSSIWHPLLVSFVFYLISSLLKIIFRFIAQSFQRLDDFVVKIPMDKEKISLLEENSLMRLELDKITRRNEELIKLHTYIKGFYVDINSTTSDLATRGKSMITALSQSTMDHNLKNALSGSINQSIDLTNKIQTFKNNVANVYNIKD